MAKSNTHDTSILEYALRALEQDRDFLQAKIDDIRRQLGDKTVSAPAIQKKRGRPAKAVKPVELEVVTGEKHSMNDASRKKISLAQKKRWAAHRKNLKAAAAAAE